MVTFPPGEDPDTVVQSQGAEGLKGFLRGAVDLLDRELQLLDDRGYFDSIDRTRRAVDKLLPTLRAVADPALRDLYVAKVAERTGVRRTTLEEEVAPSSEPRAGRGFAASGGGGRTRARTPRLELGPERQLLLLLLHSREWVERAAERVGPDDFRDSASREIFERLLDDPDLSPDQGEWSPQALRRLEILMGDPEELEDAGRIFDESVAVLEDRRLQLRQERLKAALIAAENIAEKREIMEELNTLRMERPGRWNVIRRGRPPAPNLKTEGTDR